MNRPVLGSRLEHAGSTVECHFALRAKQMTNNKRQKKSSKSRAGRVAQRPGAWVAPFPPRMVRTFKYLDTVTHTEGSAGGGYVHVFTPSSMYDPNNTGAGHQPMFYDQLISSTGPYTRYRVLSVKARVTFTCLSSSPSGVGLFASSSLSGPPSIIAAIERPWSKWTTVCGNASGKPVATLTMDVPAHEALGITKRHLLDDDNYAGYYNSSPGINFSIMTFLYGLGASVGSASVCVEFDIVAELFSLAAVGPS